MVFENVQSVDIRFTPDKRFIITITMSDDRNYMFESHLVKNYYKLQPFIGIPIYHAVTNIGLIEDTLTLTIQESEEEFPLVFYKVREL